MTKSCLRELKIEVTHQCPLACVHCSSDAFIYNKSTITVSDCIRIINDASKLKTEEISFSGGEPLLWNGLIECVSLATNLGIKTIVYTCGNIDEFDNRCFALINAGLKEIIFSLYASEPHEHDIITRKFGSFSRTLNAIDIAVRHKLVVKVHFVVMKSNYQQLEGIIKICELHDIKSLGLLRFVPQGRGKMLNSALMNCNEYNHLKDIIKRNKKKKVIIRTGSPLNFLMVNEKPECLSGIDRLVICPDLSIYPCDAFKGFSTNDFSKNDEYSNLTDKSLIDCWRESKYLNLIRSKINDYGDTCLRCSSFNECKSGCLAQKKAIYGDISNKPDPSCLMNRSE